MATLIQQAPPEKKDSTSRLVFPPLWEEDMAPQTEPHFNTIMYVKMALTYLYKDDPKVMVRSDSIVYWDPTDNRKRVYPDIFVVRGVELPSDAPYKIFDWGVAPGFIMEVLSGDAGDDTKTWQRKIHRDVTVKKELYLNEFGVEEYFLFDFRSGRLFGYRRTPNGGYEALKSDQGHLQSTWLDVTFYMEPSFSFYALRILDSEGKSVPDYFVLQQKMNELELKWDREHFAKECIQEELEQERIEKEKERLEKEKERQAKEKERLEKERLFRLLKKHNIDPSDTSWEK